MGLKSLQRGVFGPMPFARLGYAHALSATADAFFAVSLAGSLFFNVSVDAARPRIILYLLLTMAPFAIVAPLIGPLVDRLSGVRTVFIALTMAIRGFLCLLVAGDLKTLLFYPETFAVLLVGKGYGVARSATVPGLVSGTDQLVAANSRISRISSLAGTLGGGLAAAILGLTGGSVVIRLAALIYFGATVVALQIPQGRERPRAAPEVERAETHTRSIVLGASANTVLRASIGFLAFLIAFGFRRANEPLWLYGAVLLAVGFGNFSATIVSPILKRRWLSEERLFAAALLVAGLAGLVSAWLYNRPSLFVAGFVIGLGANVSRQAFDSVLQRDAPDAVRGRSFARFEMRFQLGWVVGAIVPVVFTMSPRAGLALLGAALVVFLVAYLMGISIENRVMVALRRLLGRAPAATPAADPPEPRAAASTRTPP